MKNISAIIIAKNEEKMIGKALESISFCKEIILITNGSTDSTKEIALNLGAKVFDINSNDFSEIRNFGMQKAEGEWVLYIDADERVSESLKKSIMSVNDNEYSSYLIQRKNYYFGKEWPYIENMRRLFKKSDFVRWEGVIHETPICNGKIGALDGFLLHFTHRDLDSMVNKTLPWSTVEARIRFDANHPQMSWWRFPRIMLSAFLRSYVYQKGFKAGSIGLIESLYQAFSSFITYAKLWEMQNKSRIESTKSKSVQ